LRAANRGLVWESWLSRGCQRGGAAREAIRGLRGFLILSLRQSAALVLIDRRNCRKEKGHFPGGDGQYWIRQKKARTVGSDRGLKEVGRRERGVEIVHLQGRV